MTKDEDCCKECLEKARKHKLRKTIRDYTPAPICCIETRAVKDFMFVTIMYEVEGLVEAHRISEFYS